MKRFVLCIGAIFLLLAGCSAPADTELRYKETPSEYETVNDLEGVTLELLSFTAEGASFSFVNNSTHTVCAYGAYEVEKLVNGTWMAFTYAPTGYGPGPTPSCYFEVLPGGRSDSEHHGQDISFSYYYSDSSGQLKPGTYRIIKPVYLNGETKEWHYLAAEFTIE